MFRIGCPGQLSLYRSTYSRCRIGSFLKIHLKREKITCADRRIDSISTVLGGLENSALQISCSCHTHICRLFMVTWRVEHWVDLVSLSFYSCFRYCGFFTFKGGHVMIIRTNNGVLLVEGFNQYYFSDLF